MTLKYGVIPTVKRESVPSSCQLVREHAHVSQGTFLVLEPGSLLGASIGAYETQGHGGACQATVCLRVLRKGTGALSIQAGSSLHLVCSERRQLHLQDGSGCCWILLLLVVYPQHQRHALFGHQGFTLSLLRWLLGGGSLESLLAAIRLGVHAGADFGLAVLWAAVGLVTDHQDDDEHQHGSNNYAANNDDHSASQKLAVHETTLADLTGRVELHAADHTCGR